MTLTKANIVESLITELNLNRNDARILVDNFYQEIIDALRVDETVKLTGLGSFKALKKNARFGLDLNTLQSVEISPRRVVSFSAADKLKQALTDKARANTDPASNIENIN